jgi:hypothetical protein
VGRAGHLAPDAAVDARHEASLRCAIIAAAIALSCTPSGERSDSASVAGVDGVALVTRAPRDTSCALGEAFQEPQPDSSPQKITQDLPSSQTVDCRIRDDRRPVRVTLEADLVHDFVTVVRVALPETTQALRTVDADAPPMGTRYFFALDYDGDGYRDLALLSFWGATGNRGYQIYRYDSTASRFVQDSVLSAEGNPEPEPGRRCVRSHSVGGMAGGIRREATHCRLGDRWVMMRLEDQDWNDSLGAFIRVVHHRRGDSLRLVRVDTVRDSTFR